MKGIGIVFAGGGGKGAYEIGVWKYLHEIGLDQYVRVVSGTSVGALNAALFVGSSYELAEELWVNIQPKKILTPKKISLTEILAWLAMQGFTLSNPILKEVVKGTAVVASKTIYGAEKIAQLLLKNIHGDYIFARDGLISMIKDGLNVERLQNSEISCFATCLRCPSLKIDRFKLNDYKDEDITKILLASSAIPIVFPNELFDGKIYCDGGIPIVGDNVPVGPVYDTGVENIIVVHLSRDSVIDKNNYPNSKIIEIIPSSDLGDALTGTLDFTSSGSKKRIQLGYEDAKRVMQPMVDIILMNVENQRNLRTAQQKNMEFEKRKAKLREEELSIKQAMAEDGFDDIYFELTKEK